MVAGREGLILPACPLYTSFVLKLNELEDHRTFEVALRRKQPLAMEILNSPALAD